MKKVKLERYPYGKSSTAYKRAKVWLREHGTNGWDFFDYPEYAGMPKNISNKLMGDEVDYIQDCWPINPLDDMEFGPCEG